MNVLNEFLCYIEKTRGEDTAMTMAFIIAVTLIVLYVYLCIITNGWLLLAIPGAVAWWMGAAFYEFLTKEHDDEETT